MNRGTGLLSMLAAALVGALTAAAVLLWARPAAAPDGAALRGWLLSHPEVVSEAMDRLQARQADAAVAANAPAITTAFPGAVAGNPRGDVTLTEFYDYACGYCRQSVADIDRLVAADPRLRVVFKELPILSPLSDEAARMSLAAAQAGRFSAFHHALFGAGRLDGASLATAARAAGVTAAAADAPAIAREIAGTMETARALHLQGTPTFVIGDQLLAGAVGFDQLKQAIVDARHGAAG